MAPAFAPYRGKHGHARDFDRVVTAILGTVNGTLAALRRMRHRNRGTIVQVGSALAYRAIPLQAAYCGAKFAIRGFTDALRSELIHDGGRVHVTMVQMPALNTPQFDWCRTRMPREPQRVPPVLQPEVAPQAIVRAANHRRRELWVGAPTWRAIVLNRLLPGLHSGAIDRYLARYAHASQQAATLVTPDRRDNLWQPVPGAVALAIAAVAAFAVPRRQRLR